MALKHWNKPNYDLLKKKALEAARRREDDERYAKLQSGANIVRIMPSWSAKGVWFKSYGVHYDVGMNGEAVTCAVATVGAESCPVDRVVKNCWRSGSQEDKTLARRIKLVRRYAVNAVFPKTDPKAVKVLVFGEMVLEALNGIFFGNPDAEQDPHDFTDPEKGQNIIITKTERKTDQGTFPQYDVVLGKKVTLLTDDLLGKMADLDEMMDSKVLPDADVEALVTGESVAPKVATPAKPVPKKAAEPVEEESETTEGDEETGPALEDKGGEEEKTSKPKVESEDETDEEEAPAPPKGKSAADLLRLHLSKGKGVPGGKK